MAETVLMYKCRQCRKRFDVHASLPSTHESLKDHIDRLNYAWLTGKEAVQRWKDAGSPNVLHVHSCTKQTSGIADLVGIMNL